MKTFLLYAWMCLSLLSTAAAQAELPDAGQFTYQYLTTREGLSNQRVLSMLEDSLGQMWIATKSGVDCYDSRRIRNYALFDRDNIATEGALHITLVQDDRRRIWAYTHSGNVYRYVPQEDRFRLILDLRELTGGTLERLNHLYMDGKQRIWIAGKNAFYLYHTADGSLQTIHRNICVQHIEPAGTSLYLSATEGLYACDAEGASFRLLMGDMPVQCSLWDPQTQWLWVGTFDSGIRLLDTRNGQPIHCPGLVSLPHLPCRSLAFYNDHTLLIGIDGWGVYAAGRDASCVSPFLNADASGPIGHLKGNGVYALCPDRTGNVWVGCYTGGITCALPQPYRYKLVSYSKDVQSLCDNHVNHVLEDCHGNYWYATNNGVSLYCHEDGSWHHFLPGKVLLTLCEDSQGRVWTGGYGTGAYCLERHTGIVRHLTAANSPLATDYIYSIARDADGDLWMGGVYGKLTCYVPPSASGTQEQFRHYDLTLLNRIVSLNRDTIAIATPAGLCLLRKSDDRLERHFTSPTRAGTHSNSFIYCLHFQDNHRVWLGTDGGGLNLLDLSTGQAVTYSQKDGLPSNYIYGLQPDSDGRLWIGTDKGLAYLTSTDNGQYAITNVGFLDGTPNEFNLWSFSRLRDGSFVYGGVQGAVHFHPDEFELRHDEMPLYFTAFELPSRNARPDPLQPEVNRQWQQGETVRLPHDRNSFQVSFVSVSYGDARSILYTYCLEGFDGAWSAPGTEADVRYTNLPPGGYTFRVRSVSKDGRRTLGESQLSLVIAQPFWNTLPAWIVYLLLLSGLSYFVYRFFANKIAQKHFAEKIDFFVHTAHDIRTPVTLIMAPLNDLAREQALSAEGRRFLQLARDNTHRLYNLITQLLDFQKLDTSRHSLKLQPHTFGAYLQGKASSFHSLCQQKQLTLTLRGMESEAVVCFDYDKMDKIIENLLSNAIKYTPQGGEIEVILQETDRRVVLLVRDTGIGIPRAAQRKIFSNFYRAQNAANSRETGSGIGLLLTRKLVRMHKGNITFYSREGEGTTFRVTFPRSTAKATEEMKLLSYPPEGQTSMTDEQPTTTEYVEHRVEESEHALPTTLVLVEDNDELRFYLSHTFNKEYRVVPFADAESAEAYILRKGADLLVSDVMLPGMQGDELCTRLKSNFTTSHIPVILLTARSEKDDILKGLERGADDYLTKPFDTDILKSKLHSVLLNRRMLRDTLLRTSADVSDPSGTPEYPESINPLDVEFLQRCTALVDERLADPDFSITLLCRELAMSRTLFYGKLKALTGQAPNEFIRTIRMNRAAQLLKQQMAVHEVASQVGFPDVKYFSTAFKKFFGTSPSKFSEGE